MKNGEQPANSHSEFLNTVNGLGVNQQFQGLTKREYFAAMAMQALIGRMQESDTKQKTIQASLILADELLKQLEK